MAKLRELAPEMRGCAVLGPDGEVLAATAEPRRWAEGARQLFAAADEAGGRPADHVHVATGDGEVFAVRESGHTIVAVSERFVLASLMVFDLRTALRELER